MKMTTLVLALSLAAGTSGMTQTTPPLPLAEQNTVTVINQALRSLLVIEREAPVTPAGRLKGPDRQDEGPGEGSGFFISKQGHAITNHHVVAGATRLTVQVQGSNRDFEARVVGAAPDHDLALIQVLGVPADLIQPLPFGDSDALRVGQTTIALGSPFGMTFSASTGIVSSLARVVPVGWQDIPQPTIQTDAAINPGSSGGPLLNSAGQVIGVNTQLLSPGSGFNVGVGFAIPSNVVTKLLTRLQAGERIVSPTLGIDLAPIDLQSVPADLRARFSLPGEGALVSQVTPGGPGARAGLKGGTERYSTPLGPVFLGGDVVTAFGGQRVRTPDELRALVFLRKSGDTVQVQVQRGPQTQTLTVTLQAPTLSTHGQGQAVASYDLALRTRPLAPWFISSEWSALLL